MNMTFCSHEELKSMVMRDIGSFPCPEPMFFPEAPGGMVTACIPK